MHFVCYKFFHINFSNLDNFCFFMLEAGIFIIFILEEAECFSKHLFHGISVARKTNIFFSKHRYHCCCVCFIHKGITVAVWVCWLPNHHEFVGVVLAFTIFHFPRFWIVCIYAKAETGYFLFSCQNHYPKAHSLPQTKKKYINRLCCSRIWDVKKAVCHKNR